MMYKRLSLIALISLLILAACQQTGDTRQDAAAAQSFFPNIPNYTVQQTQDLQSGITSALTAAGLGTGNFVATGVMLKVDDIISCYRDVGALDARIYVENPTSDLIRDGIRPPIGGVLAIVNQDRLINNLGPCLTRNPLGGFSAQAVTPEPCTGAGTFQFNGDTIGYFFAATDRPLCGFFEQHFAQYNPTVQQPGTGR